MPLKQKLKDFLDENRVKYITMFHSAAYTAQELAHTLHIPGKMFAKTVVLKSNGKYLMAVLPATHKVNFNLFKKVAHVNELELPAEDDVMKHFPQCEAGAMPPFGNLYEMPVYVDVSLTEDKEIYFNATSLYEVIRMSFRDYENLVHPVVGTFASHN